MRWTVFALSCGLLLAGICGCRPEPQIVQYTVKREHRAGDPSAGEAAKSSEPRDRMLGAIVPQGDMHWFFKLTGDRQAVAGMTDKFEQLIRSLQFSAGPGGGKPSWKLPDGWTQKPGSEMRFATIEIPAEPKPAELSVIPLPRDPAADDAPAVLANVNRWRGQLGLKPLSADELATQTKQIEVAGVKVTLTDFEGTLSGSGMAPFAGGGAATPRPEMTAPTRSPVAGPTNQPQGAEPASSLPFSFTKPAGWLDSPATQFRKLAFQTPGEPSALVTVIDLDGGAASALAPNVNRWRQQVGLASVADDQIAKEVKKVSFGAVEGEYVELVGSEQTILAAIARSGDRGWFFKLLGERAVAEKEKANFESFLQSVKFK